MTQTRIVKWGSSLAVLIPQGVAELAGMREGDAIVIEAVKGQITLRRKHRLSTLAEFVAQITANNRYDEISDGVESEERNESSGNRSVRESKLLTRF